mgnify:CR=1 FL=1
MSGRAGLEPGLERRLIEVAANEDGAAPAALVRPPFALKIALQDHVDGLKHQAAILTGDVDDALGAQDVGPLLGQQLVEPAGEGLAVDRSIQRQADAADVVLMGVTAGTVVMGVTVIVIVPMAVVMATMLVMDVAVLAMGRIDEFGSDPESDPTRSSPARCAGSGPGD